jgi:hypothetical protein
VVALLGLGLAPALLVALAAAAVARADARAYALADLSAAATLTVTFGRPEVVLGLAPPPDDLERLHRAFATLEAERGDVPRWQRVAMAEPMSAAQAAYLLALTERHVNWTRQTAPGACERCRAWAATEPAEGIAPAEPFWHHPGCRCRPRPVVTERPGGHP